MTGQIPIAPINTEPESACTCDNCVEGCTCDSCSCEDCTCQTCGHSA
ncbi:MAG: hypothetical protein JWP82_3307 [Humibacillus sp.]|nr:hypothetical protein [Humibacillus sp.]